LDELQAIAIKNEILTNSKNIDQILNNSEWSLIYETDEFFLKKESSFQEY
jgi:hypothetical protein